MSDKADAKGTDEAKFADKYAKLWAAFAQARAQRRDRLARDLPETADAFAALALSDDAADLIAGHLDVLADERKMLKKLARYVRKHGSDVLSPASAPSLAKPAPKPRSTRSTVGAGTVATPLVAAPKTRAARSKPSAAAAASSKSSAAKSSAAKSSAAKSAVSKSAVSKSAVTKSAVAKSAVAKSAAIKSSVAKSAVASSSGTPGSRGRGRG